MPAEDNRTTKELFGETEGSFNHFALVVSSASFSEARQQYDRPQSYAEQRDFNPSPIETGELSTAMAVSASISCHLVLFAET
jgi:hypothetical protein